jgi:hypothetical protein
MNCTFLQKCVTSKRFSIRVALFLKKYTTTNQYSLWVAFSKRKMCNSIRFFNMSCTFLSKNAQLATDYWYELRLSKEMCNLKFFSYELHFSPQCVTSNRFLIWVALFLGKYATSNPYSMWIALSKRNVQIHLVFQYKLHFSQTTRY